MGAREGQRGGAQTARNRVMAVGIDMLGRRQVMPRSEDDPMRRHICIGSFGAGGGLSTPMEGNQEAGKEGGAGHVNKYITIIDIS